MGCVNAWRGGPGLAPLYRTIPQELKEPVVAATLSVYRKVMTSLLPTPAKSHYTFNLRDISRVMQGFLLMPHTLLGSGAAARDKYLRLWSHEVRERIRAHAPAACSQATPHHTIRVCSP